MPQANRDGPQPGFLDVALRPAVMRRGLGYAVIVGAILLFINHGDSILEGDVTTGRLAKMGLTVIVPCLVSTFSSVGAIRSTDQGRSEDEQSAS